MMAAIAAILGFLSSTAPMLVQWLTLKENNAQAIRMEELRQQGEKLKIAGEVDIANTQADVRQADHIYDFANGASGYPWVDAMAAFIRPFVTLVFFLFFILMEIGLFIYGVNSGYDLGQLVKLLWDENTQAIFGAIMGFWFGNRLIVRGRQQEMAATLAVTKGS